MKLQNEMFTIEEDKGQEVKIRLNPDHEIYRAHFPGNPITPGVCIVQIISEVLGEQQHRQLALNSIVNLKFVSTISPVEDPEVDITFTSVETTDEGCKTKGVIMAGEQLKTKFSIVFFDKQSREAGRI